MATKKATFKHLDELKIFIFAICAIVLLESIALIKGVDGVIYGSSMAGIGTIGGFVLKCYLNDHRKRK